MDAQDLKETLRMQEILRVFQQLKDHRRFNRSYLLCDIAFLAVSAVMCGCDGWEDMGDWTHDAMKFLGPLMKRPRGRTPSADTFRRVFAHISPESFERCFLAWTAFPKTSGPTVATNNNNIPHIAIDGKTARRSFLHAWDKTPLHMVSAFATENQLLLGQLKVNGKENEITAIPRLLELLDLRQSTVTIDAIGCQKQIARKIVEGKGDYLLALKENQKALCQSVVNLLDDAILEDFKDLRHDYFEETTGDHGRIETRKTWVTGNLRWIKTAKQWPGLRQVVVVESTRETREKTTTERRYYIASHRTLDAKRTAGIIRSHWGIENRVHWILDVVFNEDQCPIRRENGPENFARLRRIVLNKLKTYVDPSGRKPSLRMKRKLCGWNFNYFLNVLTA